MGGTAPALPVVCQCGGVWRCTDGTAEGLIGYAGNWGGQGIIASLLFSGVSFRDFSTPFPSNALTFRTWPSTYYTLPQPWLFNDSQVLLQDGPQGTKYTPRDYHVS